MPDSSSSANLVALPYYRRQLIAVADDAIAKQLAAAAENPNPKQDVWSGILKVAALGVGGSVAAALTEIAIKAVRDLKERGINVLTIGNSEASTLTFPPGHPRSNVLYIGHPAKPHVYYTAAQFHRVTFEHKFSEAIRILMCLGATHIKVEFIRGWKRDFAAQLSVPLGPAPAASVSASVGTQSRENLLFEATLCSNRLAALPDDLIWYAHEPTWQNIADGRLNHGLMDFSLTVSYEDDFGINLGLTASAQRAGMELGGKFEDHQNTVWQVVGKFSHSPS
jgi:hypothetical protein